VSTAAGVLRRADALAAFTEVPGEITRPYGTQALLGARETVRGWMDEAGLAVRDDTVGNLIGRREGIRGGAPAFLLGSHIDSVRDAGRYDGPLGVLVAIAAAARLEGEPLPFPVEVVAFADEEGLRFRASYLASRAVAGLLPAEELDATDDNGVSLADAVEAMGGDPASLRSAARRPSELAGYLEVHIEQGPVLQAEGLPVGIVTAIAGQSRGFVDVTGEPGHAGNTPMGLRHDALPAAAELVLRVEELARSTEGLIATVGRLEVSPNVGNVIPGRVTLSYDVRHPDDGGREDAIGRLREGAAAVCRERGLAHEWRHLQEHPAVPMSPRFRHVLARAVERAGVDVLELGSGAGHDAVSMAHLTEVAMLFVRCKDGISHHPDESVDEQDVAVAIEVVIAFLRLLAEDELHG
jgi:allantoate deiminase